MILNVLISNYYIYQHRRLDTNQVFYVGRGVNNRAYIKQGRNIYWSRIVNKTTYSVEFLIKNITKELADLCEIEAIDLYKKRNIKLVNMTFGGDGNSAGMPLSEITKQKLSNALKGIKKTPEHILNMKKGKLGIKPSDESKKKMSISQKKLRKIVQHPMLGKKQSKEAKQKMSIAKTGTKRSELTVKKIVNYLNNTYFITNGINSKRIKGDFVIPFGWFFGKAPYKHFNKADR